MWGGGSHVCLESVVEWSATRYSPCQSLANGQACCQALRLQLQPLQRAISSTQAAAAMTVVVPPKAQEIVETSETSTGVASVKEGDVTESLAADMSALERKQLVQTLNKQSREDRVAATQGELLKQAARNLATVNAVPIVCVHGSSCLAGQLEFVPFEVG